MEKGIFIKDIKPGTQVEGLFCVLSKSLRKTKNGAPFLSITLSDNSGEVEARVWDNAEEIAIRFDKGDFVLIKAEAIEFNSKVQLKVNELKSLDTEKIKVEHFLPSARCNLDIALELVYKAIKEIKDASLRVLLTEIFSDKKLEKEFKEAPAAKKMHHAYIGGLLEHVVSLIDLTKLVCKKYEHLKKDLLITSCILHDIGKIRELKWAPPPIDYSDEGRLLGHIAIGIEIIDRACKIIGIETNSGSILSLKHIILSHHGHREFGSPVLPMTEEALIFHMIDDMDAKINFLWGLKEKAEEDDKGYKWSEYQRLFERYFFLPPIVEEEKNPIKKQGLMQSRLFEPREDSHES